MSIVSTCPECSKQVRVPETLLGKSVRCPVCKAVFTAGESEPEQASAPGPVKEPAGYTPEPELQPRKRKRSDTEQGDSGYDDDEDYDDRPRRKRRPRRDFLPHNGTLILVLGILSLVVCGLLGPVAWVMGNRDIKEIRSGRMDPEGAGTTNAGRICGMISSILMMVGCGIYALIFAIGIAGAGLKR